jgi:hypothetical protein
MSGSRWLTTTGRDVNTAGGYQPLAIEDDIEPENQ